MELSRLAKWVEAEIGKEENLVAFAKKVKISHTTISNLTHKKIKNPSYRLIERLAVGTNTNLLTLVTEISPELVTKRQIAEATVDQIQRIPEDQRETINILIRSIVKGSNETK